MTAKTVENSKNRRQQTFQKIVVRYWVCEISDRIGSHLFFGTPVGLEPSLLHNWLRVGLIARLRTPPIPPQYSELCPRGNNVQW